MSLLDDGPVRRFLRERLPMFGQKTMFFPPKDPEIAKNIHLDTPAKARKSTKWLTKEWNKAKKRKDRDRMKHLKSAAVLAANRSGVIAKNPRVSAPEKKEALQIQKIYQSWYKKKKLPKK